MRFTIEHLEECESTNTLLREKALAGAEEGTVIVTSYQTKGRGKPGREWLSAKGENLLFSLLIRPQIPASQAPLLTQVACRAVARVLLENYKKSVQFKRPNDLLFDGKKICGTLVESHTTSNKIEFVIIGIGLNVNSPSSHLLEAATSLAEITGKQHNLDILLLEILDQLKTDLEKNYAPFH